MIYIRDILFIFFITATCYAQSYEFSAVFWGDPSWTATQPDSLPNTVAQDSLEDENIINLINNGINGKNASFTILLGDLTNGDAQTRCDELKAVYDHLDSIYYVLPGNHDAEFEDYHPGNRMKYFLDTWTYPPVGTTGSVNGGWYFTKDSWAFIHINTTAQDSQFHTIDADTIKKYLNVHNDKYKVELGHVPMTGRWNDINEAEIKDSLEAHTDEIVLCFAGHKELFWNKIENGIDYRISNSGNRKHGYEIWWIDFYDDGSYQTVLIRSTSRP